MTRILPWPALLLLAGCGEAERPRFVPATAATSAPPPASTTAGRRPGDAASREVVVPKNIPMH